MGVCTDHFDGYLRIHPFFDQAPQNPVILPAAQVRLTCGPEATVEQLRAIASFAPLPVARAQDSSGFPHYRTEGLVAPARRNEPTGRSW